jgi:hypothetical protein
MMSATTSSDDIDDQLLERDNYDDPLVIPKVDFYSIKNLFSFII